MAREVCLLGDGFRLVLRVDGYERAELSGSDANWLAGEVVLTLGQARGFRANVRVSLQTVDLEQFRDELGVLDRESTGEATFEHLRSQVGVTVRLTAGKGTLSGFVREHEGPELRFQDVATDQSFVRKALRDLDAVVSAFPVRGDPSD
jgi:hypothetical protein